MLNEVKIEGIVSFEPKCFQSGELYIHKINFRWERDGKTKKVYFGDAVQFTKKADLGIVKGDMIVVEGELETNSYEDKVTKKKVYKTQIIAKSITKLSCEVIKEVEPAKPYTNSFENSDGDIPF